MGQDAGVVVAAWELNHRVGEERREVDVVTAACRGIELWKLHGGVACWEVGVVTGAAAGLSGFSLALGGVGDGLLGTGVAPRQRVAEVGLWVVDGVGVTIDIRKITHSKMIVDLVDRVEAPEVGIHPDGGIAGGRLVLTIEDGG